MDKSMYFLHIPKTGGLSIQLLKEILVKYNISHYPNKYQQGIKDFTNFKDYKFIAWHFGITPIKNMENNLDYATMLREPLDRVISNFCWLLMSGYLDYIKSYDGLTVLEKLKNYLFKDEYYSDHKNYQTMFLSASISDAHLEAYTQEKYDLVGPVSSWYKMEYTKYLEYDDLNKNITLPNLQRSISWHLDLSEISLEVAKNTIDSCTILGTTEDHDLFIAKLFQWFRDNLDLDLELEFNQLLKDRLEVRGEPRHNFSQFTDEDGTVYTTESLKALLTQDEIAQIYADNALDVELYNYAKTKLK